MTSRGHSCHQYLVVEEEEDTRHKFFSADHSKMEDSSSNGKLEETQKVQEGEVESVRDVRIDDYSLEHAKKAHHGDEEPDELADEKIPESVESGEVVEEKDEEFPVSVVETEASVCNDVKPEEKEEEKQYVPSLDETDGSSPAVEDVVPKPIDDEEEILSDLVSNGVEESALPSLSEDITNVESKESEETEVPWSEEKEEEVSVAVADVVSKGVEEVKLPVVEEISTGESSGAAYKVPSESVEEDTLKASPEVPAPPPVESADAGEGYGKREIDASAGNPSIVSVTRNPLQPTSWRSCCGLFEVLRRSDR